jgi:hypothetical protein
MTTAIYLSCTFRDFTGSANDQLQLNFLRSLNAQTDQHFRLVVTLFGEKNVKDAVTGILGDRAIFVVSAAPPGSRYSHSQVLVNAIKLPKEPEALLGWCTVDISLPADFLQVSRQVLMPLSNGAVTSHPHVHRIGDKFYPQPTSSGFDIFIAKLTPATKAAFERQLCSYLNVDWGCFENFLCALFKEQGCEMINLVEILPVLKLLNDRTLTKEPAMWMMSSARSNEIQLRRYLADSGLPADFLSLAYCHSTFRIAMETLWYRRFIDTLVLPLIFLVPGRLRAAVPQSVKALVYRAIRY